ncbi:MAG: 2-succinyl-5-enolpyruvyl-6-hydroxy-3-cyclohexene-1-carboxylic-acid synthase [Burkholderiales bacterium]|jgi:2-succinyl-5-enolpyruvyl-6-hydroxy-3-cyclohexene-1-carboxylate synthase|nr:2-succinyl-5-enolpyruvyl-6-hydroxy-3-cyclohexene-1-carboxylic-acid synthase [Burkholderiales bacterium]
MTALKTCSDHVEFNRRWAEVLLTALSRHSVRDVCIAPGSRSTPLTLEAVINDKFTCHTHFDERSLGYFALGLAKASRHPVAIIVTSGTAAANLYPALIEASLSGERLVLLTADRPPEQIDCGANQAIRQNNMYADHPAQTLHLPRPTPDISASWLTSAIDDAMARLHFGALHINCPFAEPLYGEKENIYVHWSEELGTWWNSDAPWLREEMPAAIPQQRDWFQWRRKKGVVVAGKMSAEDGARVAEWTQSLGWLLLSDVLSQTGQPLPYANLWLAHEQAQNVLRQAEIVVQFGSHLTGKQLLQWQAACRPQEYWLIDPKPKRLDPAHHRGRRLIANISEWLMAHPTEPRSAWDDTLAQLSKKTKTYIMQKLGDSLSEALLAYRLAELLPHDGQLFLGNSLILRLIDALAQLPAGYSVYANRGASGIDGLLSAAAGVARASSKPTLAVVGDLSALYDLNALALLRQIESPLALIVVNNNGGGIFSLLPTPKDERERYYCMPHDLDFSHAATMFGMDYVTPEDWQTLKKSVHAVWRQNRRAVIELRVPKSEGAETLQALLQNTGGL